MTLLMLAERILGIVLSILGIANIIKDGLDALGLKFGKNAQETTPYNIETIVGTNNGLLEQPVYGLSAIEAAVQAVRHDTSADPRPDLDYLVTLLLALSPTPLPETPPPGYGGATADDVWAEVLPSLVLCGEGGPMQAGQQLEEIHADGYANSFHRGYPYIGNPYFVLHACDPYRAIIDLTNPTPYSALLPPSVDWSTWDDFSGIVAFLNAYEGVSTWTDASLVSGQPRMAVRPATTNPLDSSFYACVVQSWMLPYVSGHAWSKSALLRRQLPPVWPGLELVTLGTPVELGEGVTIDELMDGVIITLTGVPELMQFYEFDAQRSYVRAGALAFADDAGNVEGFQPFSFVQEVFTPRRLWRAAHVYVRADPFLVGTVTPWLTTIATDLPPL